MAEDQVQSTGVTEIQALTEVLVASHHHTSKRLFYSRQCLP